MIHIVRDLDVLYASCHNAHYIPYISPDNLKASAIGNVTPLLRGVSERVRDASQTPKGLAVLINLRTAVFTAFGHRAPERHHAIRQMAPAGRLWKRSASPSTRQRTRARARADARTPAAVATDTRTRLGISNRSSFSRARSDRSFIIRRGRLTLQSPRRVRVRACVFAWVSVCLCVCVCLRAFHRAQINILLHFFLNVFEYENRVLPENVKQTIRECTHFSFVAILQ